MMFKWIPVLIFAFSTTAQAMPQLWDLTCVASNGVAFSALNGQTSHDEAVIQSRWGFLKKDFSASLQEGFNGTTLIALTSDDASYFIALNLDLESQEIQALEGSLSRPNLFPSLSPIFIARVNCSVLLHP